jgi:methionine-S-sulfoxide reductase
VGYSGGNRKNPTYTSLGNHAESIQIDFDPKVISYDKLLQVFWASHDPTEQSWSTQYKAAVFYHTDEQKKVAQETRDREAAKRRRPIRTEILPASEFYPAEAYHQKYRLRQNRALMKEFHDLYPSDEEFMNSTLAARVNGYLAGYGTLESIQKELDGFGLSAEAQEKLLDSLKNRRRW